MTIQLNGKPHSAETAKTLLDLLEELGFSGKPVVVEHRQEAIFPRDYASRVLKEGDQVEIISIAAGG